MDCTVKEKRSREKFKVLQDEGKFFLEKRKIKKAQFMSSLFSKKCLLLKKIKKIKNPQNLTKCH